MKNVKPMASVVLLLLVIIVVGVDCSVFADTDPSQGGKTTTQTTAPNTSTTTVDINYVIMYLSYIGKLI